MNTALKRCSRCRHEKPSSEFFRRGDGLVSACKACTRARNMENAEKVKASKAAWYNKNRDKELAMQRERRAIDPTYAARWRQMSSDKARAIKARYHAANPEKRAEARARYRARKLQAIPPWQTEADRQAIAALHAEAQRLTKETGILHHVDHIVPLRGRNICGLHVPGNLQVLPANDNLKKSNTFQEALHG